MCDIYFGEILFELVLLISTTELKLNGIVTIVNVFLR